MGVVALQYQHHILELSSLTSLFIALAALPAKTAISGYGIIVLLALGRQLSFPFALILRLAPTVSISNSWKETFFKPR